MWQAIATYVSKHEVRYLFGCASLLTTDPGEVSGLFFLLKQKHYAPAKFRVSPLPETRFLNLNERPAVKNRRALLLRLPSLIRGYLRVGAWVCGPPALDPEFGTTDFFLLMDVDKMNARYRQRLGYAGSRVHRAGA
jgi:putative hemolysin